MQPVVTPFRQLQTLHNFLRTRIRTNNNAAAAKVYRTSESSLFIDLYCECHQAQQANSNASGNQHDSTEFHL